MKKSRPDRPGGSMALHSCIYEGTLRHRRFSPVENHFTYPLFMMYLDLSELPTLFKGRWLWSANGFSPAWFRRRDHLGEPSVPLDQAVRDLVEERTGSRPQGPIRLLTHLRYFGYCFNPVSFYYCFDGAGSSVETIVAEVNNTPWGERYCYVLEQKMNQGDALHKRFCFKKVFLVSPFMDLDIDYDWRFREPDKRLFVHMDNWKAGQRFFDATLLLVKREISGFELARVLTRYPLMTLKVTSAIHFQALRLWLKRCPFYGYQNWQKQKP